MRWLSLGLVCAMGTCAFEARAQGPDKAAAEALFGEGRRLLAEGKTAEACPKFEASQKLDPGVGTALNLAECYEQIGKTASAWAQFREAVSLARAIGSVDREQLARERAAALEQRLVRLTIDVAGPRPDGLQVRRNGTQLEPAELGISIPVDPGTYVVTATAPGRAEFSRRVQVTREGSTATVTIPELAPALQSSETAPAPPAAFSPPAATSDGVSAQKTLAAVAAGLGVAGIAVGSAFGLSAASSWDDAKAKCTDYPRGCDSRGETLEDEARRSALWSTIGFGAGAVLLGTGAVLWFTAGPSSSESASFGVGPAGATLKGRF